MNDTPLSHLAVVDVETTGLEAGFHQVWEVALKLPDKAEHQDYHWFLPVDLGKADPVALKIGRFYERYDRKSVRNLLDFAREVEELTRGRHLVGMVVSFDEERLRRILRGNNACPGWHYHLVDVEALAAGKLGIPPPWKSADLSRALGVEPPSLEEAHSATRDVQWAWDLYLAVMYREAP